MQVECQKFLPDFRIEVKKITFKLLIDIHCCEKEKLLNRVLCYKISTNSFRKLAYSNAICRELF